MTVEISDEKLKGVMEIIIIEYPNVTDGEVKDAICEDWENEEEHQKWLDKAEASEIASWLLATELLNYYYARCLVVKL